MDSPDELPGRVQLVFAAGFLSLWGAITFVPRLWGEDLFYEHFYLVGGALSLLWRPVVAHFGPRLVKRPRQQRAADEIPVDDAHLLRRARRAARVYTVRRASA